VTFTGVRPLEGGSSHLKNLPVESEKSSDQRKDPGKKQVKKEQETGRGRSREPDVFGGKEAHQPGAAHRDT